MRTQTVGLWTALVLTVVLAGCGGTGAMNQGTDRVTLDTEVPEVTETADGWRFEVVVTSSRSSTDHRWEDVTVSGHDSDGRDVCELEIGAVEAEATRRGTVTCDRAPLFFVTRSARLHGSVSESSKGGFIERIGREDGTDTLLQASGLAVRSVDAAGPNYGTIPELATGRAEIEVSASQYAQCRVLVSGSERRDVFAETAWSSVDLLYPPNETRVVVSNAGETGVRHDGHRLRPDDIRTMNGTEGLVEAIERVRGDGADPGDHFESVNGSRNGTREATYRYTASEGTPTALHAALLGTDERTSLLTVPYRADAETATHSSGISNASVRPRESCADTPWTYRVDGTLGAVYAVTVDGEMWTITVTSEFHRPDTGAGDA